MQSTAAATLGNMYVSVNDTLLQLAFHRQSAESTEPPRLDQIPFVREGLALDLVEILEPIPLPEDDDPLQVALKHAGHQILNALAEGLKEGHL